MSPTPRPTPEQAISEAVGIADAVTLQLEGAPLDAPATGGATLSLADALGAALHNSPELQASLARVRVALADANQARLLPNPILNLVLRFPGDGGTANVEAGVSAELLSLLQRPHRSSAADHRLRRAVEQSVSVSLSVAAGLQEQYAEVQALDELTRVLGERLDVSSRLLALARSRLDFGEASRLDVTTLEAQGVQLGLELAEREAERREQRLALARLIGRPSDEAAWSLEDWTPLPELAADEPQWLAVALEQRPEIRSARWELAALGDEAAAAGRTALQGTALGLDGQRDPEGSLGPSVALPLPLFDLGGARRDRAEAARIEARHELVAAQRGVVEEVRRAYASYEASRARLERVRTDLLPLQQQRREQVEQIYLAGLADVTAVLLAEQDLQASQAQRVELERRAAVSLVRLERAVGGSGVARRIGREAPLTPEEPPRQETAR